MSQIENSRVCPLSPDPSVASKQRDTEGHLDESSDSKCSFLDSPIRARICRFQNSNEKRLNYALQSRRTSDGRVSSGTQMFTHSKNRPPLDFMPNLLHSENEQKAIEQANKVTSTNSPYTFELLEAAICNELADGMASDNNNGMSTEAQSEAGKVHVAHEVETIQCEGEEERLGAEAASVGTTQQAVATGQTDTTQVSTVATLQILAATRQEQNLKPILKRKDLLERLVALSPSSPLPPPILKKRDSFSEALLPQPQATVSNGK